MSLGAEAAAPPSALHVVLVAPEIPWNTGNIGRTCLALGAHLHLVRPLGFSLDQRRVRRAGLDYWQHVEPTVWPSWSNFETHIAERTGLELEHYGWFFSGDGQTSPAGAQLAAPALLIFGSETTGLPGDLRQRFAHRLLAITMTDGPVRSLNLSTAVAIALYECQRSATTLSPPSPLLKSSGVLP